jgi:glycosyltransferase involved in cell wall biosynthesis
MLPKLIIQIPCFNEEATLPLALAELPRELSGVREVEWLIINDGSSDRTVQVAREHGVDHIVDLPHHQGLARGFMAGIEEALRQGADIIVNTDADNQYNAADIPKLIEPILRNRADLVVGARPIATISHFSPLKKFLQKLGSSIVRTVSRVEVDDAPSGFRAFSRETALRLRVWGNYTYTLETLIQAGTSGMRVQSIPIRVNGYLRPSRLFRSMPAYVARSVYTVLRIYLLYRPVCFFSALAVALFVASIGLFTRWLYLNIYEFSKTGKLHLPSLIAGAVLLLLAAQTWLFGLMADLSAANRKLLEEIRLEQRRRALAPGYPSDLYEPVATRRAGA